MVADASVDDYHALFLPGGTKLSHVAERIVERAPTGHLEGDIRHKLERSMATRPEAGWPALSPSRCRQARASRAAR
ncbi:hypothetical protein [Streptomyces sp. 1222.5]|uniref:hypothetical protein n=1 Tax=Streptomyces sp. 1222.5 TaxID=1881026 RepID=UPI003D72F5A7